MFVDASHLLQRRAIGRVGKGLRVAVVALATLVVNKLRGGLSDPAGQLISEELGI